MQYSIHRAASAIPLDGSWDSPAWKSAEVAPITHFHPRSSSHHPQAAAKLLYDGGGLHVIFRVSDRYVVCRHTQMQDPVCRDSCVEAFLQPKSDAGFFNFELNCGGAMLLYYVTDPTRTNGGIAGYEEVAPELMSKIRIYHSMPAKVDPELDAPTDWTVQYYVPNEVFERYVGALDSPRDRKWRGNFYKCADNSSHPHWGSWAPIGEVLNFHVPEYFAEIRFAP